MSFGAPWMLLGLIAVALPIVIHLIGRQRAKVVRFAALDFLLATKRRTARRLRIRELALLIARVLACLALGLAVAKPFASCRRSTQPVHRGPQAAVFIIDDSYVADYSVGGRTLLSRAVEQAQRILAQLGPEAEVALVRAAEGAELAGELTRDHVRMRDRLRDLSPTATPPDTGRALAHAAQLLAASSHERRTVFLLSALTRSGVRSKLLGENSPWGTDGPELVTVPLRGDAQLPNHAIVRVNTERDPSSSSRGIAVTAEVANFSTEAAKNIDVLLRIEGQAVARGTMDLAPGERRNKRFLATLPEGRRAATVEVRIADHGLAIDDRRLVRAVLRDQIHVLLIDGDARATRHDDELFYVQAALRPGDRGDTGVDLTVLRPEDLEDAALDNFDVVVLANVPALSAERVARLSTWVRAGGGLWITGGDRVDPNAYNVSMLPLLPQELRDPIDTGWGATGADQAGRALNLVKWESEHPIFAPFAAEASGLSAARFAKVLLLGPTTNSSDRKVLARFSNGAAALVEASVGGGRILLWTTSIDRDWNDFPIHPGYLPMVVGAVSHLARREGPNTAGDHLVGRGVLIPVGDATRIEVTPPRGAASIFSGDRIAGRRSIRFADTAVPGIYAVATSNDSGSPRQHEDLAFAVNPDPRGFDLAALSPADLPASGTGTGDKRGPQRRTIELWHALAAALLLLLLAEGLLTQRQA